MNLYPPEPEPGASVPPASQSGMPAGPSISPTPPKRKLSIGFFILGFATPWVVGALTSALMGVFAGIGVVGSFLAIAPPGVTFLAQLAAWVIGRTNGNDRLRSWGLGGVATVALLVLAVLLLFGACATGIVGY